MSIRDITDAAAAAHAYIELGWEPIPLRPHAKLPKGEWKEAKRWEPAEIVSAFAEPTNIGIALGERSGGLVDIDFDWSEAARVADEMLPALPSFGRPGASRSHRVVFSRMQEGREVFQLPTALALELGAGRAMVIELRGRGHQTMFPPSTHPSGEIVTWDGEPSAIPTIDGADLKRRCGLCAALAVIVKLYPRVPGDRDNICLALTGALVRAGLSDNDIDRAVTLVAKLAGDEEAGQRGGKAVASRAKIEANERAWGLPELCTRLGHPALEPVLREWLGGTTASTTVRTSREILIVPGRSPEMVDQAEQALIEGGTAIYQRGETLVRVVKLDSTEGGAGVRRDEGTVTLKPVTQPWLLEQLARSATWLAVTDAGPVQKDPPSRVARAYLARLGEWNVPSLLGVIQAPTMRADGTLLQEPGYDPLSRLLYEPAGAVFPAVPESPTRDEALAALAVLKKPFRKFAFADDASRSVALAAALTSLVRASLSSAPMFAIDAPTAGTGKSLLAETIGIIATGHKPAMMSQGATPEEDQKRLSSVLMAGDPVLVIDNCDRQISGDFLCSMLTQEIVQTRVLGRSEMVRLPQKTLVIATGNNLQLAGDVTRRALVCRLDAQVERPDHIQYDFDPRVEAQTDRAKLVVAGLTILRAYIAAGRPQRLPTIGSFEQWNVVREALVWLGETDPVVTRERIMANDPRRAQIAELLQLWHATLGDREVHLNELSYDNVAGGAGAANQRKVLADALSALTNRPQFNARSIGRALAREVDRIVGGLVLRARDHSGGKLYRVERAGEPPQTPPPPEQEEIPF